MGQGFALEVYGGKKTVNLGGERRVGGGGGPKSRMRVPNGAKNHCTILQDVGLELSPLETVDEEASSW